MSQSHAGLHLAATSMVVSDLERSTRFYCDGLGFTAGETGERGDRAATYMELPTCKYRVRYLWRPDMRLELVEFEVPEPIGERTRRPSNQLGYQTTSYVCPDPQGVAARLVELGGTIILSDKFANGRYDGVMLADPDGLRLLLVSAAIEDIRKLFGG